MTTHSRRFVVAGLLAGASLGLPQTALAFNENQARQLVDSVVADITKIINSGKSEGAMLRDFERIFTKYGDVPIIARYALGVEGRTASASQMKAFTAAFQRYISHKYGRRFREFIGAQIEYKSARKIKSGYEVRTNAKLSGGAPFEVTFLVSDKSGRGKFFNIFIEGVNMLLTERTEIGAMLDQRKGNLDQLIADLKAAG